VPSGWPTNPLPLDPAGKALDLASTDVMRAQVFQNAACVWRCWYCFVPFALLAGDQKRGEWFTADELLDLYEKEDCPPFVIDLSGGSPDLTPEWPVWMLESIGRRGLDKRVYVWSDDNLSTDYFWRCLSQGERRSLVKSSTYGRVCCFKGFDAASFSFNTMASPRSFDEQFRFMGRLLAEGLDCYAYVTLTGPSNQGVREAMRRFVDRLQDLDRNLPLRTVPLHISEFSPVTPRLNAARERALDAQHEAIKAWVCEVDRRFTAEEQGLSIAEVACGSRYRCQLP
jgi:uncharacterized Fe-S cluster-containing radical SAM superfamily protein